MAFVEQELAGDEAERCGLEDEGLNSCGESVEVTGAIAALVLTPFASFDAGESDMRCVGARLGLEAAGSSSADDALLEREKLGCGLDDEVKDAGALEEAEAGEVDWELGGVQRCEAGQQAIMLRGSGGAEELEGDVPGVGFGPAQMGRGGTQTGGEPGEFRDGGVCQRNGEEEAHGGKIATQRVGKSTSQLTQFAVG